MSDPTDRPDAGDAAWFRSQVDPVLDAEPVPDAWASIAARSAGDSPAPAAAGGSARPRWLAAAAVLVLLAAATLVVAATRDDGDGADSVQAGHGEATGWYVPTGLPDGWHLTTAEVTDGAPCDGTMLRWKTSPEAAGSDGSRPAVELAYSSCQALPSDAGAAGPALGARTIPSFVAPSKEDPSWEVVRWEDDGLWELTGEGITGDRLIEAAGHIADHPGSSDAPLPGLSVTSSGGHQDVRPRSAPSVEVSLESPDGLRVRYQLVVPGEGPVLTPFTSDEERPVAGQPLPLRRRGNIPMEQFTRGMGFAEGYRFGAWPGADVLVPETTYPMSDGAGQATPVTATAAVEALAGSLRPATAEAWRAFLSTATEPVQDPRLLTADVLAGLATAPTATTSTSTSTTAPVTTTSSTPPANSGPVTSEPGVVIPRDEPNDRLRPLAGLDARVELSTGVLAMPGGAQGTLVLRNTGDRPVVINECSILQMQWGLVPADAPDTAVPGRNYADCYDTESVRVDPGETVREPIRWGRRPIFLAQRLNNWGEPRGTLPGGAYLAVVEIPGRDETIRMSVPVTVTDPPCVTTEADVARYEGKVVADARNLADADGDTIRVVTVDEDPVLDPDDVRCDRLNVQVMNDVDRTVTGLLRF